MFFDKNINYYVELGYCKSCRKFRSIDRVAGFNSIFNNGIFFRCKCNYGAYQGKMSEEEYDKYEYLIMPEGSSELSE